MTKKDLVRACGGPERRKRADAHFSNHTERVGNQNNSAGGPKDDQQLGRLEKDVRVSAFQQKSDDDGREHGRDTDDCEHEW